MNHNVLWILTKIYEICDSSSPVFASTGYTGHWGHQFSDSSSQRLLCSWTDQHTIQKQAFLTPVFMQLWFKKFNKASIKLKITVLSTC